jgi:hypothetical protein
MRLARWSAGTVIIFTCLFFVCPAEEAYAYIDPGTGSYLLQFLIGAVFASLFAIKAFWSRIRASLPRVFRRTQDPPDE